jgi:endothelin-converting enzyme/putative endopeptidase
MVFSTLALLFGKTSRTHYHSSRLLLFFARSGQTHMKKFCLACIALLVLISFAAAQQKPAAATSGSSAEPALPYSPSLDVSSMDKTVDPCVDFYQYSCGGWQKKNPIPADQSSWGVYGKLYQDNLAFLRGILEQAADAKGKRDMVTQEIGDFYAACMDEAGIEKLGAGALKPQLAAIDQVKSARDIAPVLANMQLELGGVLFGSGVRQDPDNSEQQIIGVSQGGIGLPDRDYYTKDDAKSKEIREHYVQHVQKIFELLGDNAETAKQNADAVMKIETALATASMTRVERRDPYKNKNKIKLAELEQMVPDFDWIAYFRALKTRQFEIINVAPTSFFRELDTLLKDEPVANLRSYLRYHLANGYSPYLSSAFVEENFDFFTRFLRGAKEMQPRWKRCVQFTDRDLGEALGQAYVRKVFSPKLKASTVDMVRRIEDAMAQRVEQLDWMSPATKEQALAKLHGIRNKIGYPDKWRDYSSAKITSNDFLGDVQRLTEFERHRNFNKLGQPVDHGEWGMSPPTVNAYYNPAMNDINFPAGVLQPPLYDAKIDAAPNYGDTGGTIGHELTHGFDDQGAKFDAMGNLRDWWTAEDKSKFEERTKCIADQYAQYVVVDDVHINSQLTLGEDVADLGGEILAYIAWKSATKGKDLKTVDDLTPEQRFFIGFAQWDCSNDRPENLRLRAMTDPHSPSKYRINGVVVNMPEFASAFSCKAGQPMVNPPEKVCKVW